MGAIENKSVIAQMSTEMGLISNLLVNDRNSTVKDEDDELHDAIVKHTENVSKLFFPGEHNKVH